MDALAIFAPIMVFLIVKTIVDTRSKERSARLKLIEQALQNPNVDRATITALTQQLTGQKPPGQSPGQEAGRGLRLLLALGWLTLFSGLGVLVLGMMTRSSETSAAGVLTALIGFGFVTYPFALRELENRRQAG